MYISMIIIYIRSQLWSYFMSPSDSQKLREYISRLIKKQLLTEAAAQAGLAALLARALADKILDDVDRIGFLYVATNVRSKFRSDTRRKGPPVEGATGHNAIAYTIYPKQKKYTVVGTASSKAEILSTFDADNAAHYMRALSRDMFEKYDGHFIVLGNSYYDSTTGLTERSRFENNISKFESIGQSFLSDYVASEENKKRILDVFQSVAAVGYFAAAFIVVITQGEAAGSRGHVSSESTTSTPLSGELLIANNAMTLTREQSDIWQLGMGLIGDEQLEYLGAATGENPIVPRTKLKINPKGKVWGILPILKGFRQQIKSIIAAETTYIHELQHLIQHAGYQSPSSQLDPESLKKLPITSTQHPLHPYSKTNDNGSDTPRLAGLAKSKRPPAQHVKIVSEMLKEMNIIKGSEIKIAGVNSPAFEINESFYSSSDARLYTPYRGSLVDEPFVELQLQASRVSVGDLSLAELVVKHISDTYLTPFPGTKKPEEREAQLKRFGSARGKKSVARKYRLFIADILADIGVRYYQTVEFDRKDQTKASLGLGPRDITVPKALAALKKNKGNANQKKYSDAIKRLEQSLVNKGGKLSQNLIENIGQVFPTMVFYSRKLNVFVGRSIYGSHRFIQQAFFIKFLENFDLSEDLLSDLRKLAAEKGKFAKGDDLVQDFIRQLDLVLVIAQSGADASFVGELTRLESQVGKAGRVSKGFSYSGSAWYKRAYGYVWRRLQTEYDAEFVTGTAGFLYGLHIIGTEDKMTASRILAPTDIMGFFEGTSMARFMFALLEENIETVTSYIKSFSKKSRHNFKGYIDQDIVKQKSDQYRRLAIDMIDKIQNISNEELTDIKIKAIDASIGKLYNSQAKKATQKQIDGLTPELDDFLAGKNKDRSRRTLPKNLIMGIIGYVGKKLLE